MCDKEQTVRSLSLFSSVRWVRLAQDLSAPKVRENHSGGIIKNTVSPCPHPLPSNSGDLGKSQESASVTNTLNISGSGNPGTLPLLSRAGPWSITYCCRTNYPHPLFSSLKQQWTFIISHSSWGLGVQEWLTCMVLIQEVVVKNLLKAGLHPPPLLTLEEEGSEDAVSPQVKIVVLSLVSSGTQVCISEIHNLNGSALLCVTHVTACPLPLSLFWYHS